MRHINIRSNEPFTHYAGRDCGRHKDIGLGNPFIVGKHGARGECCELFGMLIFGADFLDAKRLLEEGDPLPVIRKLLKTGYSLEELESLQSEITSTIMKLPKDAVLGCWCKPNKCHCESIIQYWDWTH